MEENFVIEKGIPVVKSRRPTRRKYPFSNMELGDSFLVPINNGESNRVRSIVSSSIAYYQHEYGWKFCTRVVEGGIRVWRLE